jgi:uncharacterized protein YbjT (DUF2867 family)
MKILVLGANGRTGIHVVARALERGHEVAALVRHPGQLDAAQGVRIVVGDALSAADLSPLVGWADVAVSTLRHDRQANHDVIDAGAAAFLAAAENGPKPRYIVVSQALLFATTNPLILLLRRLLRSAVTDSRKMEKRLQKSGAAYTVVRAPRLKDGGAAKGYRTLIGSRPDGGMSMERTDLASFLVSEAEGSAHVRCVVGIV